MDMYALRIFIRCSSYSAKHLIVIDEFQINVDLRTSGFDNEVLSVDACAV